MVEPPIACTLSFADLQQRSVLIRELSRDALSASRRTGLTLQLIYDRSAAPRVRRLVRQERTCCAFLHFALTEDAAGLELMITAPERARGAADFIFAQFVAKSEPNVIESAPTRKEPK